MIFLNSTKRERRKKKLRKKKKTLVQKVLVHIYISQLRRSEAAAVVHVWHDSVIRVKRLIHMCDMSAVSMCDRTHSFVCSTARRPWDSFAWHASFIRVTWLGGCPSCWVLTTRLVQWLSWVFATPKKRKKVGRAWGWPALYHFLYKFPRRFDEDTVSEIILSQIDTQKWTEYQNLQNET